MKQVRTAILSFGMSGKVFHAPFIYAHPGFELYAVWERTKNLASQYYSSIKTFRSLDELLKDETIELVIVNTPNITHFEFAEKVLKAGKNVLVEKPFTVNADEAQKLLKLAEEKNLKISVYHNRRWDSDFLTTKKVKNSGMLGDIVDAELHFDRFSPGLSPKLHKETPGAGTGVLHDLGSHLIDAAIQLFGMPDKVFADLRIVRPVATVSDYMNLILFYPKLRVQLRSSYLVRDPLPAFILHGTKGSYYKSRADVQEAELRNEKLPNHKDWGIEPASEKGYVSIDGLDRKYVETEKGNYMQFFDQLHSSITSDHESPVTALQALNVMKIIDAAIHSNQTQKIAAI